MMVTRVKMLTYAKKKKGITLARRLRYADTERGAGRRYRPRFARGLPKGATRVWRCGAGSDIPTTDLSIYPASLRALW